MRARMICLFCALSFVFLFFGSSVFAADGPGNRVKPGEFVVEPPTLINLGFEWYIEGDDNRNAAVEVQYRKKGDAAWKKGLSLLRIENEVSRVRHGKVNTTVGEWHYVAPNMFAGSIFDLAPDTE